VSYGIIQEHAGSIEVFNRPSGGARFLIDLPLASVAATKPASVA
jgi:K+-sensing histidine kinase KdpD